MQFVNLDVNAVKAVQTTTSVYVKNFSDAVLYEVNTWNNNSRSFILSDLGISAPVIKVSIGCNYIATIPSAFNLKTPVKILENSQRI